MQVYISKEGRQWGPYELKQIRYLVNRRSFELTDWAWMSTSPGWVPVSQVLDVCEKLEAAAAAMRPKTEYQAPVVKAKIDKPKKGKAVTKKPITAKATATTEESGGWFYWALGLGTAMFVGLIVWSGDEPVDFNSLELENGVAFEPDSKSPFEGRAELRYPNGQLMFEMEFDEGRQNGMMSSFYADGTKESEGTLVQGQFHGKVVYYHRNGQIKSHYKYENGQPVTRKNWDENGNMVDRTE